MSEVGGGAYRLTGNDAAERESAGKAKQTQGMTHVNILEQGKSLSLPLPNPT